MIERTHRLRLLSDAETSYADRLNEANARVQTALALLNTERARTQRALTALKAERHALERLLLNAPCASVLVIDLAVNVDTDAARCPADSRSSSASTQST